MGTAGVAEVRGGEAGESHHHTFFGVVLRRTRYGGQESAAPYLGQRQLAQESVRLEKLDSRA